MRHVILTCKDHPHLRWSCKEIAFDDEHGYNGTRHLHYKGTVRIIDGAPQMYSDMSGVQCDFLEPECACPVECLTRASEDALVRRD